MGQDKRKAATAKSSSDRVVFTGKDITVSSVVKDDLVIKNRSLTQDEQMENAIRSFLSALGEDPKRPGLVDTPERVSRAWLECWGSGYRKKDVASLITLFNEPGFASTQMVTVHKIAFYSHCEHHLAPFFGEAHISYIPSKKGVVGISKFARVVDHFARRLQVQERLTNEVADFLRKHLSKDVAVMMEATHSCMASRGVMQPNARTVTTALRGDYFLTQATREEFYRAIGR